MKTALIIGSWLMCVSAWAAPRSVTCLMYSSGNEAPFTMTVTAAGVAVQMGEGEPDNCLLDPNANFDLHAKCGEGADAVYFGVKRNAGKIYADFGTIAQLKNCRLLN